MAFWKFTGSNPEFFPTLGFTAQPGSVYDLGSWSPPNEPLPKDDQKYPAVLNKWTSDPGPATAWLPGQVVDPSATYAALTAKGREQVSTLNSTALRRWYADLAARDAAPANIVMVGDSLVEGNHVSAVSKRYQARVRDYFRTGPFAVTGAKTGGSGHFLPAYYGVPNLAAPCTPSRGFVQPASFGPGARSYQLTQANDTMTYTVTGTSAKVMYSTANGNGTFSYAVDGGAATNVSTNVAGAQVDGVLTASIPLGASGSHTLVISWVSGGAVIIDGIVLWDGDESAGVRVYDAAHGGQASNVYTTSPRLGFMQGWMTAFAPSLVVLAWGINDMSGNIAPATFEANLKSTIASIRSAGLSPSFVLLADYDAHVGLVGPLTYSWSQYVAAMWDVALTDTGGPGGASGVTVCDLTMRLPATTDNSLSLFYTDNIHPLDKGHAMIADALSRFLTPQ